jgi:DNA-directed RNA polymerase subunit RPC12/RpoP
MEDAADSRAAAWAEREANTVAKHTTDLTVMHGAKREMRRDVYRAAPALEGRIGSSHPIYEHPIEQPITLPGSPSDWRSFKNMRAELKRRHPEHFEAERHASPRRRFSLNRERQRQAAAVASAVRQAERAHRVDAPPPPVARAPYTGCQDCGRPWLSDLSPEGRYCPQCSGPILIEGQEIR